MERVAKATSSPVAGFEPRLKFQVPARAGVRVGHPSGGAVPSLGLRLRGRLLPEDRAFVEYLLCARPCPWS